mgnify:FL=1
MKCFRKMEEIRQNGTTILFVTHDTTTVKSFCSRAILLNHGCQVMDGAPKDVVMQYFDILFPQNSEFTENPNETGAIHKEEIVEESERDYSAAEIIVSPDVSDRNFGLGGAMLEYLKIAGINNSMVATGGERICVGAKYKWDAKEIIRLAKENSVSENLIMGISLSNSKGTYLFGCTTYDKNIHIDIDSNLDEVVFSFDMPHLQEGKYFLNAAFALGTQESHVQLCWYDGLIELQIESSKKYIYGVFYNEYEAHMKRWIS